MKQLTILLRSMFLIGAAVSLITLTGCGRNENQGGANSGTTGDNTGTYNNTDTGSGTMGSADLKNRDSVGPGVTGAGGQSADRDQTGSIARRGGTGAPVPDNTGLGTGVGTGTGDNITGEQSQLEHRIRQSLLKDNSFGSDVKNLKIIASNGTVTLRGPVTTQEMKDKIEARVKSLPGVKSVDNQLQVTNSGQ